METPPDEKMCFGPAAAAPTKYLLSACHPAHYQCEPTRCTMINFCRKSMFLLALWQCIIFQFATAADDDSTASPTTAPTSGGTVWWQQTWLFFTYFELYFIGVAILIGGFVACFTLFVCLFPKDHPLQLIINFFEEVQIAQKRSNSERFGDSSSLLGKQRS